MIKKLVLLLARVSSQLVLVTKDTQYPVERTSTWQFDYAEGGNDWHTAIPPKEFTGKNRCAEEGTQSPINLF